MSTVLPKDLDDLAGSDYIDSRDLEARRDELQAQYDDPEDDALDEDEREELAELNEICGEGSSTAEDWPYGATLIREDCFEDYARELAEDIGALPRDATWPANRIDWEAAANDLAVDYSEIEIRGTTYYVR